MTTLTIESLDKGIINAVAGSEKSKTQWLDNGLMARKLFVTKEALEKQQDHFYSIIQRAISKKYQIDFIRDLPRKNTKQYDTWLTGIPSSTDATSLEYPRNQQEAQKLNFGTALTASQVFDLHMYRKIVARAIINKYWRDLVSYAFPQEKKEKTAENGSQEDSEDGSEDGSDNVTLKTRILTDISALIKKCQKSEGEDFDITATVAALQAVINTVSK